MKSTQTRIQKRKTKKKMEEGREGVLKRKHRQGNE